MPPASLDWHTCKNSICLLTVLLTCVFVMLSALSAIAKILVHLPGEEKGWGETEEVRSRERDKEEKGECM